MLLIDVEYSGFVIAGSSGGGNQTCLSLYSLWYANSKSSSGLGNHYVPHPLNKSLCIDLYTVDHKIFVVKNFSLTIFSDKN